MRARAVAAAGWLAIVAGLGGCSGAATIAPGRSQVRVYVSMPMSGASGSDGRDVADGARLALADAGGKVGDLAVRGVYLDDTLGTGASARWSAAKAGENARRATQDTSAIAYIGDFESGATRTSEPITNEAQLLQVSPASTAVDLARPFLGSQELPSIEQNSGERTFGRVIPDDQAQAEAAARLTRTLDAKTVAIVPAHGAYAGTVRDAYRSALRAVRVVQGNADASFYPGLGAMRGSAGGAGQPGTRIATDAVLPPWSAQPPPGRFTYITAAAQAPSQLAATGQRFVARFERHFKYAPGPYAAYGYEAMALVLDCVKRAGNEGVDRQTVISQFFATTNRRSILGDYSVDPVGDTTLNRLGLYRARGGAGTPAPAAHGIPAR